MADVAGKRLIICSDGTWNTPHPADGSPPTNIVKLARALRPRDSQGVDQVVFYDEGIGTAGFLDYWIGGYTGLGIAKNILDAYRFLAHNWAPGDEVYLVGFSRGAFTVRSLAGFLGVSGLLRKAELDALPEAWSLFERPEQDPDRFARYRAAAVYPFSIRLVGVWDTVDALGLPLPGLRELTRPALHFHDATLGAHVANGFQALAIDEIRSAFRPLLWTNDPAPGQRIEQVWFRGAHADCGGGYPESGLSDLTLQWMIERVQTCGLEFDGEYLVRHVRPDPAQAPHYERAGFHKILPRRRRRPLTTNPNTEAIHSSAQV